MSKEIYYVYAYYDPRTGDPIYIGLGKNNRAFSHWKKGAKNRFFQNILAKLRELGLTPRIEFVSLDMSFEQAGTMEKELIALHGRRDLGLGTLCNMTDGGDGSCGYRHTKKALAGTHAGIIQYWATVDRAEHGKKISQVFAARTPEENAIVGANIKASRTPEVQAKITAAVIARQSDPDAKLLKIQQLQTPESRKKRRDSMKITSADPVRRAAMSKTSKTMWENPEYRMKHSIAQKMAWVKRKAEPKYKPSGSCHKES